MLLRQYLMLAHPFATTFEASFPAYHQQLRRQGRGQVRVVSGFKY
jgi:hypothetical protein